MGGLTAAVLLAKHGGKRVLVLERHYTAGGFTHVFHRRDYEWDVGVHYIGQVNSKQSPVRAAFDHVTEGRLHWNPMPDVYDRIVIAGRGYDFPSGMERFRENMKRYFPEEAAAIDKYIAAVCAAVAASGMYFAEKAIPGPIARLIGPLLRRKFLRYSDQTTAQVLGALTRNQELIAVLTGQWGDYGLPPAQSSFAMHATIAYHYFDGAAYPVGGASEIAASMTPIIEHAGGQIMVSAEVAEILLEGGRRAVGVRMADGAEIRAGTVISDAGAGNTFTRLLPAELSAHFGVLEEMKNIPPSIAHLCLYAGLRRGADEPEFGGTNLWIYSDADHDASVARFEKDPSGPFPVLFISFPSAKDPTFSERYPGRSTIEVVAPIPYGMFDQWADTAWKRRGAGYDDLKKKLTARLVEKLERHVPATRGRIEATEISTPLSTRHFANYLKGEIYGAACVPARFRARVFGARTPFRNLFLTGQDACTLGVGGALFGGVITASALLRRNLMGVVSRVQSR
jgi:all-trans-retinol 13,14-reductase